MKLIAKRNLSYGGHAYLAGETFEASDAHAKVLKLTKRASDAPPPPVAPAAPAAPVERPTLRLRTRETAPEPELVPSVRRYTRRDMQAEGE